MSIFRPKTVVCKWSELIILTTGVKQWKQTVTPHHHFSAVSLSTPFLFFNKSWSVQDPLVFHLSLERSLSVRSRSGAPEGWRWCRLMGWWVASEDWRLLMDRMTEYCWWCLALNDGWCRAERLLGGAEGDVGGESADSINICWVQCKWRRRCTGMNGAAKAGWFKKYLQFSHFTHQIIDSSFLGHCVSV